MFISKINDNSSMSSIGSISNLYKQKNSYIDMSKKKVNVTLDVSLCDTISQIINKAEHKPSFSQVLNDLAIKGLINKKKEKKNGK